MAKVKDSKSATALEQIPNIGTRIAEDLRLLGINEPDELKSADPYELYVRLCQKTKNYHDPCLLDVFIAAVYFMNGNGVRTWWSFTEDRKKNFYKIEDQIRSLRKG